jgi:CheY-like chemotaxis protein/HPt (histidine-containing phosphotransfer) domain-containing protein
MIDDPATELCHESDVDRSPSERPDLTLNARVLVVDDGEAHRRLIQIFLERAGASVVTAENGKEGVDRATKQEFDVILMDMQMPVMDGYTATRCLREKKLETPIIALTAHAMRGDREKCEGVGCTGYLTKPIDSDLLVKTVANALQSPGAEFDSEVPGKVSAADEPVSIDSPIVSTLPTEDPDFREIVNEFVGVLRANVVDMRQVWEANDLEELARLAHWVKESAGTAGFAELTRPADNVNVLARNRKTEELGAAISAVEGLVSRVVG